MFPPDPNSPNNHRREAVRRAALSTSAERMKREYEASKNEVATLEELYSLPSFEGDDH